MNRTLACLVAVAGIYAAQAQPAAAADAPSPAGLPAATVPQGWGVNIHFTDPAPGEMERFAEGGFGFVRMDFGWGGIEKQPGVYDFSPYDRLEESLRRAGARPLFILDYGNDLYQKGSPSTPEARAAFARFAAASAAHFAGRGVIWEIWNEPNIGFWKPKPNAADYAALAVAAAKAIKAADPKATVIAPGSSTFPWDFLETAFKVGLLERIDAVSVHPYRGQSPETAAADFARLRALIARYAPPAKRNLPMISSEWGYTTYTGGGVSEAVQAAYLGREWLANMASGVDLSIFYDWHEDGDNPKDPEHRFGITHRDPAFSPKPAFIEAKALIAGLRGYTFRHRLAGATAHDWRLLFQRDDTDDLALAVWNADPTAPIAAQTPAVVKVPRSDPQFAALRKLARIHLSAGPLAQGEGIPATLTVSYDAPGSTGAFGLEVGAPFGYRTRQSGTKAALARPRVLTLPVTPERTDAPTVTLTLTADGARLPAIAPLCIVRIDPLTVSAAPSGAAGPLRVTIANPGDVPFHGTVAVVGPEGRTVSSARLTLARGQREALASLPSPGRSAHRVVLRDADGRIAAATPMGRYLPFAGFPAAPAANAGWNRIRFVENAALSPSPLGAIAPPPGGPGGSAAALRFDYAFDKGWQYAEAAPAAAIPIPAGAKSLVVWVWSAAATGDALRCRFKDATEQTFQPDLEKLDWKGWRLVTIPLDGSGRTGHWGGANDGVPHGTRVWEGMVLVDSASREAHQGEILLAAPAYVAEGGA